MGGKGPHVQRKFRLTENREDGRALRTLGSWASSRLGFPGGRRKGLNGDAVLDEGRVQVDIGQLQAPVPLPFPDVS